MIVNLDNTTRPRARDNASLQEYLPHPPKEGEIIKVSKIFDFVSKLKMLQNQSY